jgi:hypothetical protein
MATKRKKKAATRKRIPAPKSEDRQKYDNVSVDCVTLPETSEPVCSILAWRDKHGLVLQFGGNDPLREADWSGPKGKAQIKNWADGVERKDDPNLYIHDEYSFTDALEDAIREYPEGEERDKRMLEALKESIRFDEPERSTVSLEERLQQRVLATILWVGAIL